MFAARFTNLVQARARFGDRVDRLGAFLTRVDPRADAVVQAIEEMAPGEGARLFDRLLHEGGEASPGAPPAMRDFFAAVERVPVWVDWEVIDRGGRVLLRAGPLGGLVLALKSLVLAYTSPAGNKPLVFSGRLQENAPRRLNETARFVRATILPASMRPRAAGWRVTLKVRLIHAQLRRMILRTGRWDELAWGAPINQHDQAGTSLLFSSSVLAGLRELGVRVSPDDADAYMHLWRWSGWLMGIEPELLLVTEGEAVRLANLISATQAPPDDDSRMLTRALLESPLQGARGDAQRRRAQRVVHFSAALCRLLVGDATADALAVPRSSWHSVVPLLPRLVAGVSRIRESVPFAGSSATRAGTRYWDRSVEVGLASAGAEFALPTRLSDAARGLRG